MGSTFELNVMMPVMAFNLLQSIELLAGGPRLRRSLRRRPRRQRTSAAPNWSSRSLAMCTSLAPVIGYDKAAEIAKESFKTGKTVRQVATEKKLMGDAELKKALDPMRMTQPQADIVGSGGGCGGDMVEGCLAVSVVGPTRSTV